MSDGDDNVAQPACHKIQYGPTVSQYMNLTIPRCSSAEGTAIAFIIHGGFWKQKYGVDNAAIESLAPFFISRGVAACVVEYRRVGAPDSGSPDDDDGGWPKTNNDIVLALNKIMDICDTEGLSHCKLRKDRIILLGHSAGGYLALWACMAGNRSRFPVRPFCCVALAPICDLFEATSRRLSDEGDAVEKFMCTPLRPDDPDCLAAYTAACPRCQLPLSDVPTLLVCGTADSDVPPDYVQNFYVEVVEKRMGSVELVLIDGADHYDVVNSRSQAWKQICDSLSVHYPLVSQGVVKN